jgi:hypothetical protein
MTVNKNIEPRNSSGLIDIISIEIAKIMSDLVIICNRAYTTPSARIHDSSSIFFDKIE